MAEITENEHWLLSFYRQSEISGALFFGRLARSLRPGPIQQDMTRHFADEAQHARYWTDCMDELGVTPLRLPNSYQDQYVNAAGLPVNLMEVLAITQVFERRVVRQYLTHERVEGLHPVIRKTLDKTVAEEKWHLRWIDQALKDLEPKFGAEAIQKTLARFSAADQAVYAATMREHADRVESLAIHLPR